MMTELLGKNEQCRQTQETSAADYEERDLSSTSREELSSTNAGACPSTLVSEKLTWRRWTNETVSTVTPRAHAVVNGSARAEPRHVEVVIIIRRRILPPTTWT